MNNTKRILLIAGIAVLVVCIAVLAGLLIFGGGSKEDATLPTGDLTYTVQVKNASDMPIPDVGIYIYEDETMAELVWYDTTDADGKMSFTNAASNSYVAVLSDVPAGYALEAYYPITGELTEIVLSAGTISAEDMENVTYKLGDMMPDFTVTAADGTEYTLSELLKTKRAVVLNFWYIECQPCNLEFPFMEEAYKEFSDKIEILAMNPVNQDEEAIAAFQKNLGLSFPMAKVDPAWEKMMGLTAYPTTVVIDRYGNISLVHRGMVDNTDTFRQLFEYFAADEYESKAIEDLSDVVTAEEGSEDNPQAQGGAQSFSFTVDAGKTYHFELYKITTKLYMTCKGEDFTLTYGGKEYDADGSLTITIEAEGPSTPVKFSLTNHTNEEQTYHISLANPKGSYGNPYSMKLGEFTANSKAGDEQGTYYTYIAEKTGKLQVRCLSSSISRYGFFLYNLRSYAMRNTDEDGQTDEEGCLYVTVDVKKGDKIQFNVAAARRDDNSIPAGTYYFEATLTEGDIEEEEEVEKIGYAITVTDENRKPISGVNVRFVEATVEEGAMPVNAPAVTNEKGVASVWLPKDVYSASLVVPKGYSANTTQFKLTETLTALAVKLDTVVDTSEGYTVRVLDSNGVAIPNVLVSIGTSYGYTNSTGYFTATLNKGEYTAVVTPPAGYIAEAVAYPFPADSNYQNIVLTAGTAEQAGIAYTVNVVDGSGNPMTGVAAVYTKDGVPVALAETDADGKVVVYLEPGEYTVALISSTGSELVYNHDDATLTATKTSTTVKVSVNVGGNDYETAYWGNYYKISAGTVTVDLSSNANQSSLCDNNWMYALMPSMPGVYRITASEGAVVNYWGSLNFVSGPVYTTDNEDGYFELILRSGEFDNGNQPAFVLGVGTEQDLDSVEVQIVRMGDVVGDLPTVIYEPKNTPSAFTLTEKGKATYVDLTGNATIQRGDDGFYYLNGKKLYAHLGPGASPISIYEMLGIGTSFGTGMKGKLYDENGEGIAIEDFTQCMMDYCLSMDADSGMYPVNDDIVYMFQSTAAYMHWGDIENPNYLFKDEDGNVITGINPDIAWMFAFCYFA